MNVHVLFLSLACLLGVLSIASSVVAIHCDRQSAYAMRPGLVRQWQATSYKWTLISVAWCFASGLMFMVFAVT